MQRTDLTNPLKDLDEYEAEKLARNLWDKNKAIRAEFLNENALVAYCKAVARGSVRTMTRKTVDPVKSVKKLQEGRS